MDYGLRKNQFTDNLTKGGRKLKTKYEYVHELLLEQAENISNSPYNWMAFLKTSAYMFKFPFQDQILIHAQRPNATDGLLFSYTKNGGYQIKNF